MGKGRFGSINEAWIHRQMMAEHDRLLPMLQKAYARASSSEQKRLEDLEKKFLEGDLQPFISWAKRVVPGSFSSFKSIETVASSLTLPESPGAEAIEDLPDWWPKYDVYHGTRDAVGILSTGLCAPQAFQASGDEYGWDEVWRDEIWNSYNHHLSGEQRQMFRDRSGLSGRRPGKDSIGSVIALFWVSRRRRVAESHGTVLKVNLSALRYYWWFPDEILGEESYVFVLPDNCPQALPGAFSEA